ncbi:hypothetical protein PLIIFM63780_000575 [Purpureocillium lilacinum]|nr:hypothetical protein PLIIFM63780_000575 [Purpureocillium lilacinum]
MLSYVIGLVAIVLFLGNPISQFFFPQHNRPERPEWAPRPALDESLLALEAPNDTRLDCPPDAYSTRILSREPLVLYLEGFLSADERQHLLDISEPLFEPSTITHKDKDTSRDVSVRDSAVAMVPRTPQVRCIEARARALQGWREDVYIERLRTQRYGPGGHYSHHFDWGANVQGWGRVSSFMVWVDASDDLKGGGTEFPLLQPRGEGGPRWCELVDCGSNGTLRRDDGGEDHQQPHRTVFKPRAGNAVYWENFRADGTGYDETWHAGMPVTKGVKVGLNIWSFGRIL